MEESKRSIQLSGIQGNEYDGLSNYFKEQILLAVHTFDLKIEQFPRLLGISIEKLNNILEGLPVLLTEEEKSLIIYRLTFISGGFSIDEGTDRVRLIMNSILMNEFHFSHESLAAYADVPYDVFKQFCDNTGQIDSKHLSNICVNLLMLHFVLANTNV